MVARPTFDIARFTTIVILPTSISMIWQSTSRDGASAVFSGQEGGMNAKVGV